MPNIAIIKNNNLVTIFLQYAGILDDILNRTLIACEVNMMNLKIYLIYLGKSVKSISIHI